MKRTTTLLLFGLIILTPVLACRATLQGRKALPLAAESEGGLVYYLSRPAFTIDVKERAGDKDAEPVYELRTSTTADPSRRFAISFRRGTISKDEFEIKLRPDGTLASLGAKSDTQVPELVTALGSLAASALSFGALAWISTAGSSPNTGGCGEAGFR